MASTEYDVAVIGADPGGYVAAIRAAQRGAKVAIVEKQYLGGTCLNVGCIPSKAMLHIAEVMQSVASMGELGIELSQPATLNMRKAVEFTANVVKRMTTGVGMLMKGNKIDVFDGLGTVDASRTVTVTKGESTKSDGSQQQFQAHKIILATGSVPLLPPFSGIDGRNVINSDTCWHLPKLPDSIICVGGGVIGVEPACIFNGLGSRVTILEMLPNVLAPVDNEVRTLLVRSLSKRGITKRSRNERGWARFMMDETWDPGMLSLPERSRLYHLKPIGTGTSHVENLTSYIIRLAEAHCVLPKTLIIKEILPLLTQTSEVEEPALYSYEAVLINAKALNGMGSMATRGVYALEKLTQWKDLHHLTMLPWANVISNYGLFRNTQAWCPLCFEEWRAKKSIIYTPLLWLLKALRVCLHHKCILHEKCPSLQCNKTIPVLHPNIRSGYCPYCNCWLGNTADMDKISTETVIPDEFEQEMWYATAIGELLEVAPRLSSTLQKEDLALAVDFLINRMPIKKAVSLTRLLERKSVQTVALWQKGLEIPRMNTLLQMCHLLDISLQQLFLRESDIVASNEEPPPSIHEVAQRLGYCGAYELHRRFPELANVIVTKYQKYNPSRKKRMRSIELQQALESIVASNEEPPPSIQEVAYRLGYHGVSTLYARFPDLSHAITAKYQKQNRDRREPVDAEVLRQSLEAILASNEEPPHPLER